MKMEKEIKLTKAESKAIKLLISYYATLGRGDNDSEEAGKEEEDIYSGLIKLKKLHDKNCECVKRFYKLERCQKYNCNNYTVEVLK